MINESKQNFGSKEKLELLEGIAGCNYAINQLDYFENHQNADSAWAALSSFSLVVLFFEKLPSPQAVNEALEDRNLNEKLSALVKRFKQSNILKFEEYLIDADRASPDVPSAREMVKDVKEAILRLEIYLSSTLEREKL